MASTAILVVDGLSKDYGSVSVLRDVCLEVRRDEILGIIGESGAGKTTLLKLLASVEKPNSGRIHVHAQEFDGPPAVLVWQEFALFDRLTVRENIEFGLRARGVERGERRRRASREIERFKLGDLSERQPTELSGGQRQRVALARAVVLSPPVLLLDEPLASQDGILRDELRSELRELAKNSVIVFVSHDRDDIYELADRVVVLANGTVFQDGPLPDLFGRPANRFVALFAGQYNLIPGHILRTSNSETGAGPTTGEIAVRRSMIRRLNASSAGERKVAVTVVRHQITRDGLQKVYTVLDASPGTPFVYLELGLDSPQPGERVTLCWPRNAEICLV